MPFRELITRRVLQAESIAEALAIPWDDIRLSPEDVILADLTQFSQRLVVTANALVSANQHLRKVELMLTAARDVLEFAVGQRIAAGESKLSLTQQRAAILLNDPDLSDVTGFVAELELQQMALKSTRDSLDLLWRTTSRVISARSVEPEDRS